MKSLILPLLALTCLASSQQMQANCPRPPQGLPGPLSRIFISSVSNTEQLLDFNTPTGVNFQETVAGPVGINQATDSTFIVNSSGVYLICWSVNAETNSDVNDPEIYPPPVTPGTPPTLELDLLVNGDPVVPNPISLEASLIPNPIESSSLSFANISGQTILVLDAGDVLSLEATAFFADGGETFFILISNVFNITRISNLP